MKKLLVTFVLFVAALCLFTGCLEKTDETEDGTQQPDPPAAVTGNTVTAEEWDSAFNKSILSDIVCEVTGQGANDSTAVIRLAAKEEDGKMVYHLKNTMSYAGSTSENEEIWICDENGSVYYRKYEQGWIKNTTEMQFSAENNFLFLNFSGKYSSFTYNSETDTYTAQNLTLTLNNQQVTYPAVSVKFNNKRAVSVTVTTSGESITQAEYAISYGNAVITLPSDEEIWDQTEVISADEWSSELFSFMRNHTITTVLSNGATEDTVVKNIAFDENTGAWLIKLIPAMGPENIYEIKDDKAFIYTKTGENAWIKENFTAGFNYDFCYYVHIADKYDYFVYDKEQDAYIAQNVEIAFGEADPQPFEEIKVVFDNQKRVSSVSFSSGGYVITETMSDYELTTVTLPSKDEITDKTSMSLQQWESAFDRKNFTDFTFTFTNSTTNSDSSVTTQETQNAVMTSGDGKIIHVLTYLDDSVGNERYYDYTLSPPVYYTKNASGAWESSDYDGEDYYEYILAQILVFGNLYDKFDYDSFADEYVCENIDITLGGEVFTFDKAQLKFSDGKIIGFSMYMINNDIKFLIEAEIDYTKPDLTLPVV